MFFLLSKILWFIFNPINLFFIFFGLCCLALFTRFFRPARIILVSLFCIPVVFSILNLGDLIFWHLENQFTSPKTLPSNLDGIVIAGGILNPILSHERGQPVIGGSIERLTIGAKYASEHPNAKLIFSGGSGDLFQQEKKEAHYVIPLLVQLGVNRDQIVIEDQARNTYENSIFTFKLAKPKKGEHWILITSAFHMPRAMGTFKRAGWNILATPVDFGTSKKLQWKPTLNLGQSLPKLGSALHECLGLFFYWLTDKSGILLPSSENIKDAKNSNKIRGEV